MAVVNKYNIHWQIVRCAAKDIKNVQDKVNYILNWYYQHPCYENFKRIEKWLKMSPFGFKLQVDKQVYANGLHELELNGYVKSLLDLENDFEDYNKEQLIKVKKDLLKRKYNFQYNSVPKDHIFFMQELEQYIAFYQ